MPTHSQSDHRRTSCLSLRSVQVHSSAYCTRVLNSVPSIPGIRISDTTTSKAYSCIRLTLFSTTGANYLPSASDFLCRAKGQCKSKIQSFDGRVSPLVLPKGNATVRRSTRARLVCLILRTDIPSNGSDAGIPLLAIAN
jgi:hypothetical protein